MNKLNISVLGSFKIEMNGENILEKLSQKGSGLLIYLILNEGKKISRDRLASLFWGDSSEEAARYNLRYNLWTIRKTLNKREDIIIADKNYCQAKLVKELRVDVIKFIELLKEDRKSLENLEEAKDLYRGDFLEDFFLKDCIEFNDWVFFKKEEHQREYYNLILDLSEIYRSKKEYDKAISSINDLIKINILDEKLYVKLIDLYLEKGDRPSAFNIYNRCVKVLREELNISPSKEIRDAYTRVMKEETLGDFISRDKKEIVDKPSGFIFGKIENGPIISIDLVPYPLNSHQYYILSQLVEGILSYLGPRGLEKFSTDYLIDLFRITNKVLDINKEIKYYDITNEDVIKNKVYSSASRLVEYGLDLGSIDISVSNIGYIDSYSFNFLLMILSQFKNKRLRLTLNTSNSMDTKTNIDRINILKNL